MSLDRYRKKRDFSKTTEPKGARGRRARRLRFVVQKHDASRLHYDFRLELGGVLKSWAVPKGPSLDPSQKRLAVEVEDHPLEYGRFEGVIPAGQYGGGTVLVWDRGTWVPESDPVRGLAGGSLKFRLEGEKLKGSWTLVRMRGRTAKEDRNWLLIKHADEHARAEREFAVTRERPESVATGRDLTAVRSDSTRPARKPAKAKPVQVKPIRAASPIWAARTRARQNGSRKLARSDLDAATIPGARRGRLPDWIGPQLATLVESAPDGDGWLHETKFDGYRTLCRLSRGRARWLTRSGKDWTAKFASLSSAVEGLPVEEVLLDGEVVVLRPDGTSSFQDLQNALGGDPKGLSYCVFDVLHIDGFDLRAAPLHVRKEALERLVRGAGDLRALRYSDHARGDGGAILKAACRMHLEGIVSKRRDGPYRSGRGTGWVKTKCSRQQELVIGGFTAPAGAREQFGALLLGHYEGKRLRFAGRVGTGFDRRTLKSLGAKLRGLEVKAPPFVDPPTGADARGVRWVEPKLVATIGFTEWTEEGLLRHPAFEGLREDKPAREVVREEPVPARRSVGRLEARELRPRGSRSVRVPSLSADKRSKALTEDSAEEVAGIRISHPDRILYPALGLTKLELARFYDRIGEWILPHVVDRPLSVLRCPEGSAKPCFFQRHGSGTFPESVKRADVGGAAPFLSVDSIAGVVALVQMGALELHPWGSRVDRPERPDRMVFDLDPDPAVPWPRVVETARLLRAMLGKLGMESFVKTTGGKGLHVVVPLAREHGWDEVKGFSRGIAEELARAAPDLYVATASKARRTNKVFIDYLRNTRGGSSVAAYSTRAREGAPVSTPIAWEEIGRVKNDSFGVENLVSRLKKKKDPWSGFSDLKQRISRAAMRSVTSGNRTRSARSA